MKRLVELNYRKDPKAFFRLPSQPALQSSQGLQNLLKNNKTIELVKFAGADLNSGYPPARQQVKSKMFVNINFSFININRFEFQNCKFSDSLFQGTIFNDCRFEGCEFVRCNFNRAEFKAVYVDPLSFKYSLDRFRHTNIGVYLYQQLLANSQREFQPDFEATARFYFLLWQRYHYQYTNDFLLWSGNDIYKKLHLLKKIWVSYVFQYTMGFGRKWQNFLITTATLILATTLLNFFGRATFGLCRIKTFIDAAYFSIVTLSTVGFGDITPEQPIGKVAVASESLLGLLMFAALTSLLLKRLIG